MIFIFGHVTLFWKFPKRPISGQCALDFGLVCAALYAKFGKIVHLAIKAWKSAYRHSLTSRSFWDVGPRWILPVVAMATDFELFYHRFSIIPFSPLVLKWHHSNGYHQKENGILHLIALIRTFIISIVCNNGPAKWPLSKMYFLTWGDNFFS